MDVYEELKLLGKCQKRRRGEGPVRGGGGRVVVNEENSKKMSEGVSIGGIGQGGCERRTEVIVKMQ